MERVLTGLPPMVGDDCRVLVLGSMPGDASLQATRYYAHPRNRFWPVMAALCGFAPDLAYDERLRGLLSAGVGLWDVIGQCERRGSLDACIVRNSEVANPIGDLLVTHRSIAAIALNGGKAAEAYRRHVQPTLPPTVTPAVFPLPSTSPAHAAMGEQALLHAWSAIVPFLSPQR
ncbi:DNA-deoxyinosine glycosylase [Pseudoxanthomonas sp.]|jgi:G/U mismatch-specific uracil-DNA glycosylase (EC 3.2.2.-)|uniref:DNA-deoxyinosine glycosylase n=1 Tax=Pseudoxanthomonas sp. TaxID=1871049 RepID=UPI002FE28100